MPKNKAKKQVDISRHFTRGQHISYAFPSIVMMLVIGIYEIVDGFFVSNFVGARAFAAVNMVLPIFYVFTAVGMMIGTGGSAIIANKLGEGKQEDANKIFSLFVYFCMFLGVLLTFVGLFAARPLVVLIGGEGELLEIAVYYAQMTMISLPAFIMLSMFYVYFNTAGKPRRGLANALISITLLVTLNTIFTAILGWGINGILIATITTEFVAGNIPLIYFIRKNTSLLQLVTPAKALAKQSYSKLGVIGRGCFNGCSEMVQQIAMSSVAFLTLYQINRLIGENGIVAYGVIEYAWIFFNSFYFGFATASAPLMSYQQGAKNKKEMQNLFKNGCVIIAFTSIAAFTLAETCGQFIVQIFIRNDPDLIAFATHVMQIYSVAFLFAGTSIYGSSLFTSLGNGKISAIIAFLRTAVFEVAFLLIFPELIGGEGIWWGIGLAETAAAILTVIFILAKGRGYGILPEKKQND